MGPPVREDDGFVLARPARYYGDEERPEQNPAGQVMSDVSIGKFQVEETLGSGAHSSILLVRRAADSAHYALKVVPIGEAEDQKFYDQAQHEFRIAQMLDHKNLIKIYAFE